MVSIGKEFVMNSAVSASAAGLSHVLHHPLYTLKSQMMYHGTAFRFKDFVDRSVAHPLAFLYRGRDFSIAPQSTPILMLSVGVTARVVGIMPEKAMKMQGWIIVGRYIERNFEDKTYAKWLIAGSVAGAATTVVGEIIMNRPPTY